MNTLRYGKSINYILLIVLLGCTMMNILLFLNVVEWNIIEIILLEILEGLDLVAIISILISNYFNKSKNNH